MCMKKGNPGLIYSQTCLQLSATGNNKSGLCSERQKLLIRFSRDTLRLAFVDRKTLFAGVVMHRFDCIFQGRSYRGDN